MIPLVAFQQMLGDVGARESGSSGDERNQHREAPYSLGVVWILLREPSNTRIAPGLVERYSGWKRAPKVARRPSQNPCANFLKQATLLEPKSNTPPE